jgi:hypothetical protein
VLARCFVTRFSGVLPLSGFRGQELAIARPVIGSAGDAMSESQQLGASAGTIARSGLTLVSSGLSSVEANLLPLE